MASSPATDVDFRAMPKIELHAHLSGSISRQCLHDIWARKKAAGTTDLEDPLVVMPIGKHDYDLNTFFPLFSSYIYHLVNDVESLEYSTKAVVREFSDDGVVYLELRTTPRAMPGAGLDKAGYVAAVLDAMAAAEAEIGAAAAAAAKRKEEDDGEKVGEGSISRAATIRTRLILSVDRRNTLAEAREVVALAAQFRARGVVGVDLCGDPAKGDVSLFTPAFAEARAAALPITVHFAEAASSGTDAELDTILSWGPDRLGHVIHVPERVKAAMARQRAGTAGDRDLGLELCLSCNVHAKMIVGGFEAHHFGEWWKVEGLTVVPCTDDVGVFGSPVSNEWRLIEEHFKLSREELFGLARKGIDVIFGGEEEKQRLREVMW
ncbi:hypothetical protein BX600DRAFT_496449 [Xylariales sp. PMI_506]|nr:hypothetical protein BX600DRAFT_496449 [Xylariales sp. PMI_506]